VSTYHIAFWTPIGNGSEYYKGTHPLFPENYEKFQKKIATKLQLQLVRMIPPESIVIINVIELPEDVAEAVNKRMSQNKTEEVDTIIK
jgi:hypothetical protein